MKNSFTARKLNKVFNQNYKMFECAELIKFEIFLHFLQHILDSLVVSIPACHARGRGSIPRWGDFFSLLPLNIRCRRNSSTFGYCTGALTSADTNE
jgi:hypothetical protein